MEVKVNEYTIMYKLNRQIIILGGKQYVSSRKKSYMSSKDWMLLNLALKSADYGWEERTEPERRVILTNPEALKDFEIMLYTSTFRGTGHAEWEFLMGAKFQSETVERSINFYIL